MTKPALLITVRLPEPVKARAAQAFEVRFATTDIPRTGSAIADLAHGMDAILTSTIERLDAATIAALPDSVRAIGTFSAGYDHIDIAAARARGIAVCNTPDVLSVATAE